MGIISFVITESYAKQEYKLKYRYLIKSHCSYNYKYNKHSMKYHVMVEIGEHYSLFFFRTKT